jgi:hypothetical protein
MNLDQTTELVPVSQWVYDLYEVKYWTREGGTLQRMQHYAASSEGHMWSNANEYLPGSCEFISWKIVRENVGHPTSSAICTAWRFTKMH